MTNESKPRTATETSDALNAAILRPARSLTAANIKYECATSVPSEVTALGWDIIALDLRRWGSSYLTIWRAEKCEGYAAALRSQHALDEHFARMAPVIAAINEGMARS